MTKLFSISKNGKYLGSILADKIVCDNSDNYLLFMLGNECVAYFPVENIELAVETARHIEHVSTFADYNNIPSSAFSSEEQFFDDNTSDKE